METYAHLPSPPLSPFSNCDDGLEIETFECSMQEKEIKDETTLRSPNENPIINEKEILRISFMKMIEEGIKADGVIIPYQYYIQKLHKIGNKIINKKSKDAVPLRIFEKGTENYQEFWVHPMILSLQSFQFFKLFNSLKNKNEGEIIEIEVPSLKTFAIILYYIYTGDSSKVLEIAKLEELLCKGIIDNIHYLEIITENF